MTELRTFWPDDDAAKIASALRPGCLILSCVSAISLQHSFKRLLVA